MARMTIQQRKRIQRILAARQSERPPSVQLPPSVQPPPPTTCPPGWITNSSGSFQPPPPGPVPGFLSGRSLKDYDKRLSPDSNTAGERGAYGATEVIDVVDWAY